MLFWGTFWPVPHYPPKVILGTILEEARENLGNMTRALQIADQLLKIDLVRGHNVPAHLC